MPLNSHKWSRKRKIDHSEDWLFMPPRVLQSSEGACSTVGGLQEADIGAGSAVPGGCTGGLQTQSAGRSEGRGGEIGEARSNGRGFVVESYERAFDETSRRALGETSRRAFNESVSDGRSFGEATSDKFDGGGGGGGGVPGLLHSQNSQDPSSTLLPDPTHLPHHKLVKLFKTFRLQNLHQDHRPLKIVRASHQYMYDNTNSEYLDCVNSVSHVGHCHPDVARAAYLTNNLDAVTPGWDFDWGEPAYPRQLQHTLPDHLDTFLFCDSGSEAVDLSLQLSQLHTAGTEAVVTDNAFHGCIDSVHKLSPKVFKASKMTKADWVHVVPVPDLYRGKYRREDPAALHKYLTAAREVVNGARQTGRKIACFISEPMLIIPGCIMPPSAWLQEMYKMVRECGGLCIADEVQTGMGRIGSHFWSFQAQEVIPDILIIGKTIGNGYPMAVVVTSKEIAAVLGDRIKEYRCTQVMDAVGSVVLDVVQQEQLMASAAAVGKFLLELLIKLQEKHEYLGDVRGRGLMVGIDVVWSRESRKPSQEIAEQIVHKMREEYVILASEGSERNVLMLMPPMCFTQENATSFVQRLDKVLSEMPKQQTSKEETGLLTYSMLPGMCEGRLGIIQPQEEGEEEESEELPRPRATMDLEYSQHSYQDLD